MDFTELVNTLMNTSVSIVVIGYFMYRDNKFMTQLNTTLTTLIDTVDALEEIIKKKEN